ncbi:exosome complex component Rrp45 [Arctopsyche grandis]|uniref:exosome complex component Rrp45 n=1 Tax=Arctopsyche grandis TaxID=121162 RepID=UPI00406D636E
MRELLLSNCEKTFVLNAIGEGTRLDGRQLDEARPLKISFGTEWGSCHVSLGNTKVTAHVSYKIEQPKQAKPNEGLLFINLELGPMGAPNFENRQSDLSVTLNRLLEKCIIDSRCVDLESLCIVSEEKVWGLRVDIHVLNHAGNIIECASVAALSSLAHFKRPDITTNGQEIIVHTLAERDPIPTVLHHYPVCVLFGFFSEETMISDPNLFEEMICSSVGALFTIGMNSYREVCLFDLAGAAITLGPIHIYKASQKAAKRAKDLVTSIKDALVEDESARSKGERTGFPNAISTDKLTTLAYEKLCLRLSDFDIDMSNEDLMKSSKRAKLQNPNEKEMAVIVNDDVAMLSSTNTAVSAPTWIEMASADDASSEDEQKKNNYKNTIKKDESDEDVEIVTVVTVDDRIVSKITVSSDSEENDVVMLESESKPKKLKKKNKKNKQQTPNRL